MDQQDVDADPRPEPGNQGLGNQGDVAAQLQQATATTGLKLSRNLRREEIIRLLDSGET